ncbi:MAG: carboxypeptidase-like regulatory domain-containing protein [Bacteroidales bacterium]|nr:carboxypeptidase-like regulatory domain-containing protein [Bacteroidales bacterium]HOI32495.1 carboxypeptidase-like regulatory domain-containing protein [Bacteroidales bacterium]
MKKYLILIVVLALGSITLVASNSKDGAGVAKETPAAVVMMTGTVLDAETGEALAGAVIEIENTDTKAYTDLEGHFTIENMQQGEYNVKVNYISYKETLISKLSLDTHANSVEIKLNPEGN